MTAKEFFAKPATLIVSGILIGAGLLWLASGLTTKNFNLFMASNPDTGGVEDRGKFVRPGSTGTGTTSGVGKGPVVKTYPPTSCSGEPCCTSGTGYTNAYGVTIGCSQAQS